MRKKNFAVFIACLLMLLSVTNVFADEAVSSDSILITEETSNENDLEVSSETANGQVVIYHTNDMHGYVSSSDSNIGIDQVAALKKSTENSILVDAGDATQGAPAASLTMGSDIIELMNLAGYDLMVAGNHEFDFGTEQFLSNAAKAAFPVISANAYLNGSPLLEGIQEGNSGCHVIIERGGLEIGFFGITTSSTATSTNPEGLQGVEFADEVETAKKEITELEAEGADVIIAVCHTGDTSDVPYTSNEIAEAMTGEYAGKLDAIIDGHSHTVENNEVNDVLIVQTGSNMAALGKLTVTVSNGDVSLSEELLGVEAMAGVQPDADVAAKLQEIESSQSEMLGESLGNIETTLWAGNIGGGVAITRVEETNYGDFAADAFRAAGESFVKSTGSAEEQSMPVIAVENGGGIRAALNNGTVTNGGLITTFPFSNTLYIKKVTPAVLYEVMEVSGSMLDGQDKESGMLLQGSNSGGFLQISGFTVEFDPDGEPGWRVKSITLDGQDYPLERNDDTTPIFMVSNNYIMSGGNDYTMLANIPKYGEAGGEMEIVKNYMIKCLADGTIGNYAGTQGRILMRSEGYEPKDYTVKIKISDENGNAMPGQALSYRVDGGERTNGVTDENGYLSITVSDGGHGIRLADTQQEIYVSNYSGFGIYEDAYRLVPELTFLSDGSCDAIEEEPEITITPTATPTPTPAGDENDDKDSEGESEKVDSVETGDFGSNGVTAVFAAACAGILISAVSLKANSKRNKNR